MTINLPIYPDQDILPGLGFTVKWGPRFFSMPTQTTVTGADIDLSLASEPLHDFELMYEFLRDTGRSTLEASEWKTMAGFFLQSGGVSGRFLFNWKDDNQVYQQVIGTGDGVTTTFTLSRAFGAGGYTSTESVGAVDTSSTFNAYLAGSSTPLNPTLYSLDTSLAKLQKIVFVTPPALGAAIAVDMKFYYYCKFPDDTYTFEKFMEKIWLLNSVKIHSCRAGA